jgi:hypothetical protein
MSDLIRPVRLQRSRIKGARLVSPNGLPVVYVGRETRWGNPYRVERQGLCWYVRTPLGLPKYCPSEFAARQLAVGLFRSDLLSGSLEITVGQVRESLLGRNLACWCKLGDPCHADPLMCVARGIYT